jgi:riboflavin synthase
VGVIPFTYRETNLGDLNEGAPVNVEGDLIGKYVGKVLAGRAR